MLICIFDKSGALSWVGNIYSGLIFYVPGSIPQGSGPSTCFKRGQRHAGHGPDVTLVTRLSPGRGESYADSALLMTLHWCHLLQVKLLASGPAVLRPGFVFPRFLFARSSFVRDTLGHVMNGL